MNGKPMKITNRKQFECLVDHMGEHKAIARGLKYCEAVNVSKQEFLSVWDVITTDLNKLGPPSRSSNEWQKVWLDYKHKVKRKTIAERETNQVGNFSATEEAVVSLLSLDRSENPRGKVFGLEQIASSSSSLEFRPCSPELEALTCQSPAASPAFNTATDEYPERMDSPQEENIETRYALKALELEEKKLEFKRENSIRKHKLKQEQLSYKIALLRYKQEKLNFYKEMSK